MNDRPRSMLGISFSLALLSASPLSAGAGPPAPTPAPPPAASVVRQVEVLRIAAPSRAAMPDAGSPAPCRDRAFNLQGARWQSEFRWWFRSGSTPSGLSRRAAEKAITRGVGNIVNARNDCGRADAVNVAASYRGRTTSLPSCKRTDGRNVIGFRTLPDGVAAQACWWMSGGRVVEADVQINSSVPWATSLAGCVDQLMLEAVMTHEAGHVFGLGHVAERRHGRLTMSTYIDGPCNNQESTLGLGDMRGLEALYP